MTEDQRLEAMARKTMQIQADAPRCTCQCGCQYVLVNSRSRLMTVCFGCRARVHYGGTERPQ